MPASKWLSEYNIKESLQADVIAGLTVGVMIIPQVIPGWTSPKCSVEVCVIGSLKIARNYAWVCPNSVGASSPVCLLTIMMMDDFVFQISGEVESVLYGFGAAPSLQTYVHRVLDCSSASGTLAEYGVRTRRWTPDHLRAL
eukprot:2323230-Pyramimonas_sp.AAC.2